MSGVLYFLLPEQGLSAECKKSDAQKTKQARTSAFEHVLKEYGGEKTSLVPVEGVSKLLQDVNKTIGSKLSSGKVCNSTNLTYFIQLQNLNELDII